ncbi:MAG: hypothetical protein ABR573_02265 [Candidatus Dormibacteria bacterium]
MKSVRFDAVLEDRLRLAARASQQTESQIIRVAVARHVDEILGVSVFDQIKDLVIHDGGCPAHPALPVDQEMADEMEVDEALHRRKVSLRS